MQLKVSAEEAFEFQHLDTQLSARNDDTIAGIRTKSSKRGRKPRYHDTQLTHLIFLCWLERERMCAKRLVFQIESWLAEYESKYGRIEGGLRDRLLSISAATIDRVLRTSRDEWYQSHNMKGVVNG